MEIPAETLTHDEFTLTRWTSGDAAALTAVVSGSGAHLADWMFWAVGGYTDEDSADFLHRSHENWAAGRSYDYAIRVDGAIAGSIGVMTREGGVELGYWLGRDFTGRGLITRAAALLTEDAFRRGAGYVEIKHDELNVRSGAVPARLGFSVHRKEPADVDRAPACCGTDQVWRLVKP
ncbi:GNAT family N-acetyltransferase [Amycolatopsis sp. OK19-0408]|uniref:GNAT family N-acetyltransferase n=1 Tax=Amycolatopsis iheyensis TaxID=2945988 RepID=A0A9X2N6A2_9PSEU|nr:GNAT family N-acetyltransferase [Amycolatopsis iheyensis]MCR6482759.1 GNAT family N-acetyltransferase [Amycolatopsis iheyensis]